MKLKIISKYFCQKEDRKKFSPIHIFKKDGVYFISLKELTERYKLIGVIFDRKLRAKHSRLWNNMLALGTLYYLLFNHLLSFICSFIVWWRFLDFKLTLVTNQPFILKLRIDSKVVREKGLNIEDLNFIYESPEEYELDSKLISEVEHYRLGKNLKINEKYLEDVQKPNLNLKEKKYNIK
jgi:hypothetical protein